MRASFFQSVGKFEPYSALCELGASPSQVKEAIVEILAAYVHDKMRLQELATGCLATEAISVARLSAWRGGEALLELCIDIREHAVRRNEREALEVTSYFEPAIRDAQARYALLTAFERPTESLALDEFAFEMFRLVGALVESSLQRYLQEILCLLLISAGEDFNADAVFSQELGRTCEALEARLSDRALLRPAPWDIRVNQWRNISQHHSYVIHGASIVATYGRGSTQKQLSLSRSALIEVARALTYHVGALKTSGALMIINHFDALQRYLPEVEPSRYAHATDLAASFATQGFRLLDLQVADGCVSAAIEDAAPGMGDDRAVHCSQFVATFASRFPNASVQIRYIAGGHHLWTFIASAGDLRRVMELDDPLIGLASIIGFRREPTPPTNR